MTVNEQGVKASPFDHCPNLLEKVKSQKKSTFLERERERDAKSVVQLKKKY